MELELFQIYHLKEMSLSTELFLSSSILQFTFYAISTAYQRKTGYVILTKQVYYIGILFMVFSSFLVLNEDLMLLDSLSSNNFIINDYLSFVSKLVICVFTLFFLMIVNVSFGDKPILNNFEYVILVSVSVLGLLLLCSSNDLITAYLAIELQSVAFYIMAAFKKNSTYSIESGLKYFIIGALSSTFFLLGSAIIYGFTGSLNFDDLQIFCSLSLLPNSLELNQSITYVSNYDFSFLHIGFFFLCVSVFIKLSIAPFHFWSLDVYEGSPNSTTFFFSVVPKIGLFVLLFRICYIGFYPIFTENYQLYFFLLAVLSIFIGSFGGLEQRKLKTLLAYSSVSHTGYLLLSFCTANTEGIQMMFYYLIIYMISGLCFWSVYLFLKQNQSIYDNKNNKELGDLVLLKESNPALALVMAVTLFSIAGIPPIVGFLAKLGVFLVVIQSFAYLVAAVSILFSVISTFYYIRLIKILYFENVLVGKLYQPISTKKSIIISILFLSLIVLSMDPAIIYLFFYKSILLSN